MYLPKRSIFWGLIAFVFILTSCRENGVNTITDTGSGLEINSVQPIEGKFGTEITISGTEFSETSSENTLTFNNKPAEVLSSTSTTLKVLVPKGAGSGLVQIRVGEN